MYQSHFGLAEPPFSITPDPRFLYLSRGHRDALAYLHYGIEERKGFMVLCGEVGVGKTLVIRTLLGQLSEQVESAIVMNARLEFRQLLYLALIDFGLRPTSQSKVGLLLCLQEFLLGLRDRRANAVLIIDEAQNLTEEALEDFRLLSNLEAANTKLVQIVLVGQPELRSLLRRPSLRQLRQRIPGIFDLTRLPPDALAGYVDFRLSVAGEGKAAGLFDEEALNEISIASGGIPRLINQVCDRALLVAYAKGADRVFSEHVLEAAEELEIGARVPPPSFVHRGARGQP
jgi:general secretion pathway protein A